MSGNQSDDTSSSKPLLSPSERIIGFVGTTSLTFVGGIGIFKGMLSSIDIGLNGADVWLIALSLTFFGAGAAIFFAMTSPNPAITRIQSLEAGLRTAEAQRDEAQQQRDALRRKLEALEADTRDYRVARDMEIRRLDDQLIRRMVATETESAHPLDDPVPGESTPVNPGEAGTVPGEPTPN